ncbi:MAG TPA: hypothetical protein DD723_00390 [Candidatus Omnitrophica bacterium]|nr:hypothetical protein [Candidatus Omnitrophota bacterium]
MFPKSLFLLVCIVFISTTLPMSAMATADYPRTYELYMELGKKAIDDRDYVHALNYFEYAHLLYPATQDPISYINLIKRLQQGRLEIVLPPQEKKGSRAAGMTELPIKAKEPILEKIGQFSRSRDEAVTGALDLMESTQKESAMTIQQPEQPQRAESIPFPEEKVPSLSKTVPSPERKEIKDGEMKQATAPAETLPDKKQEPSLGKVIVSQKESELLKGPKVVYLNDELWTTQPKTLLRVELNSSVVLEGRHIERSLIVIPGFIEIERVDRDRIKIIAKKRGSTFVHVWDDTGRWTLDTEVIFPAALAAIKVREKEAEEMAEPFRINYSSDWGTFYRGQEVASMERESLNLLQRIGMTGETPYGDFDSSVIYNKFEESTELTGYTVGLSDGQIGNFENFNIRGGDTSKVFSPLSVPGQYVRGILFESKAFEKNIEYIYMHGKDRQTFGFTSPSILEERQSFVEAARVTLFPKNENQYSINFARGYGSARKPFLKERVFSVEGQRKIKNTLVTSELAYDEDTLAHTAGTHYKGNNYDLNISARNIDKDFATITSLPSNRGEVGGIISGDWRVKNLTVDSSLDLYRDKFLSNPDHPEALNLDFSSSAEMVVTPNDRWRNSLYYIDTPGELSPRNNLRLHTNYSKKLKWLRGRDLNTFVGATYQRSRFDLSPSSEYDRYSLSSGLNFSLIKNLNYFLNYEYSLVDELLSGDQLKPHVMNTGLNYSRSLTESWTGNAALTYRNEDDTDGLNSFLAGEDSLIGSLGTTFRPSEDFEFFIDGRLRNVWAEGMNNSAFNEMDIRAGVRTSWETPFSWNPKGVVEGVVFEDNNGNMKQDQGEEGIRDVRIKIGNREAVTDPQGHYETTIRAKRVQVGVDIETIPDGYVFSTPVSTEVGIIPHKRQNVDFGLTTHSSIYGVIFYDKDQNGKPDPGDEFISRTKIVLDDMEAEISDFEGTYFFKNIQPGKHTITIDLNSLPMEFLPLIKLKNEIDVSEGTTYIFHVPLKKSIPALEESEEEGIDQ